MRQIHGYMTGADQDTMQAAHHAQYSIFQKAGSAAGMYSMELMMDESDFACLPKDLQERFSGFPCQGGLFEQLTMTGLRIEERLVEFHRWGDAEEDGMAQLAQKHGARFRWNRELLIAVKRSRLSSSS